MHARKYCPSQTEYYFLGRYLMYGTSKQNAFLFSNISCVDRQRGNFTDKGKINFIVMTKVTGLIDTSEKTSFWST